MSVDLYAVAESLQNARDHILVARREKAMLRGHCIECAKENIREAMKLLGMKEAKGGDDN